MSQVATVDSSDSFVAHDTPVKSVVFSPSGSLLATGHTDITVSLWHEGQMIHLLDPKSHDDRIRPTEFIRGLAFSPDESQIFVAASDTINSYSTKSGELLWQYRPPRHFGFLIVSPQALAVSKDGILAASFDYGFIATLNMSGKLLFRKSENSAPRWLGFSPQGKALVGADGFNLSVWNAETGERVHWWTQKKKIYAMAISSHEPLVVTRELYSLSLWNIDEFKQICELPSGRGLPTVAFSPTDQLIASGERSRVRLINLECKGVKDFDADDAVVLTVTFSPNGERLVAGCNDGRVRSWNL